MQCYKSRALEPVCAVLLAVLVMSVAVAPSHTLPLIVIDEACHRIGHPEPDDCWTACGCPLDSEGLILSWTFELDCLVFDPTIDFEGSGYIDIDHPVRLNGEQIASIGAIVDECCVFEMISIPVPEGLLLIGENTLEMETPDNDNVFFREIVLSGEITTPTQDLQLSCVKALYR